MDDDNNIELYFEIVNGDHGDNLYHGKNYKFTEKLGHIVNDLNKKYRVLDIQFSSTKISNSDYYSVLITYCDKHAVRQGLIDKLLDN